ncbi:hypothetical protein DYI37_19660 [Fulvimarina endophytica]|uniref:Uncharacterized protein n=1 Tax=Fulvimarina endophytica TaxID=2293836 RepID=A0A371WXP0_9HYPH|nr:hypothetical protein DYI37_19660 [Fulvimarina endophytica]
MRTRIRALPSFLSSMFQRLAAQAVISGTVMIALHAMGGGAGLYESIFGPTGPTAPHQSRMAAVEPTARQIVNEEKSQRLAIANRVVSTLARSGQAVETRNSEDTTSLAKPHAQKHQDLTVPEGVLLFTDCRTACESRDPLLVSQAESNLNEPSAPGNEDGWRIAAANSSTASAVAGLKSTIGVSRWLPGGRSVRDGWNVATAAFGQTVDRAGAIAADLTPW